MTRKVLYTGRHLPGTGAGVCADNADALEARAAEAISPAAAKCGLTGMVLHEIAIRPVVIDGGSAFALGRSTCHLRAIARTASNEAGDRRAFFTGAQQDLNAAGWGAELH